MPVALADATAPPLRVGRIDAVASVLCHTDVEDYEGLCRAATAALRPGGHFAHVGVHPCFCGHFADRSQPDQVVISSGYWSKDRHDGWSPDGVRSRVGALHLPLSALVAAITAAGLRIDAVIEIGEPSPDVLAIGAHRP